MDQFNDQVAVITGAASGLGLEVALKLNSKGVRLALLDKEIERLTDKKKLLKHAHFYKVDITDEMDVRTTVQKIAEVHGRIDILINCAGITGLTNIKSHEVDADNIQSVFAVNYFGCFYTSKYIIPWMLKEKYGRILHIASIAGKEGNAGMLAYSSSKAAVIAMTKVQGKEYADTGLTINCIAPAVIRTALVDNMPQPQVDYMTNKIPMKRCGTLQEFSDLALYVISPQNSFTTGFTFDLSGGRATY